MSNTSFMTFEPGDTFFHRLDPRSKMTFLVVMILLPLVFINIVYLGIMLAGLLLLAIASRINFHLVMNFIKPVLPLVLFMVVIQGLWGERVIFSFGPVTFYYSGLLFGIAMALRMLTMVFASAIVLITTAPADLVIGLRSVGMPYKLAFMVLTAFRFVPTLMARAALIQDAQKARGLRSGDEAGNFIRRIIALIPVLIPLYIAALEIADKLSLAMEARGFGASDRITYPRDLVMRTVDHVIIVGIALIAVIAIVARIMGYGSQLV